MKIAKPLVNKSGVKRIGMKRYSKEFGIDSINVNDKKKVHAALTHALDIRKFEIELYWTRATYFWAFIAAALAGFSLIQTVTDTEGRTYLSVLISCLGALFSFAWYCVNRGSKYWQENWENHVDLLENNITGPLYKTVVTRPTLSEDLDRGTRRIHILARLLVGPIGFSVSKINTVISLFMFVFWLLLIIHVTPFDIRSKPNWPIALLIIGTIVGIITMIGVGMTESDAAHDNLRATLRKARIRLKNR